MWEKIICNSNPTAYEHELWQHPKVVTRNSTYTNNLNFFWKYVLQMVLNVEGAHYMVSIIFL
jgi:hypothetical protein